MAEPNLNSDADLQRSSAAHEPVVLQPSGRARRKPVAGSWVLAAILTLAAGLGGAAWQQRKPSPPVMDAATHAAALALPQAPFTLPVTTIIGEPEPFTLPVVTIVGEPPHQALPRSVTPRSGDVTTLALDTHAP
jgi:hypothetical protein